MNIGLIIAGGTGQRMKMNVPKQFIKVLCPVPPAIIKPIFIILTSVKNYCFIFGII